MSLTYISESDICVRRRIGGSVLKPAWACNKDAPESVQTQHNNITLFD